MLTKLTIRNFKRFGEVEIELGNPVVFIGPNNSGKTTALQALALWDYGLRLWQERRGGAETPSKRPGVTLNRQDLISVPVPDAAHLWREAHVRDVQRIDGKPDTRNIRIEIIVEGVDGGREWKSGFEYDYANEQSFYVRPLRLTDEDSPKRMAIPPEVGGLRIAFLHPMSGLASVEPVYEPGRIDVLIGEGQTAQVLRNLCYRVVRGPEGEDRWARLKKRIGDLFGETVEVPEYVPKRGEITMSYLTRSRKNLDISSQGRGFQQTLLLLAYLASNPNTVLLLDEPDAHLEILRQRQIYGLLTEAANEEGSQLIIASHSEVILNEAADRDVVVAFVGKPHRVDDRSHRDQVQKSLKEVGFEQYIQAEQTGWVLYLEGSTDLAMLQAVARKLSHTVSRVLERPFVHYIQNQPGKARSHFYSLRESKPNLVGFILCDRLDIQPVETPELGFHMWSRREFENYLCQPQTLQAYARDLARRQNQGPLFFEAQQIEYEGLMSQCIADVVPPIALRDPSDKFWIDTKATDHFLDRVMEMFFSKLHMPNLMRKSDYHMLAQYVAAAAIDIEIEEVLTKIVAISNRAVPALDQETD
jgi:hypothetical protein